MDVKLPRSHAGIIPPGQVFADKRSARAFQAERRNPKWKIRAVEVCGGKRKRTGKGFAGARRRR